MTDGNVGIALEILKGSEPVFDQIPPPVMHQLSKTITKFNLPEFLKRCDFIVGMGMGLKSNVRHADKIEKCIVLFLSRPIGPHERKELEATIYRWFEESSLGYIPIEFKISGEAELLSVLISKQIPLLCGYSAGHCQSQSGGTIGCLVRELNGQKIFLLSNSHVFAQSGLAKPGDEIVQPCVRDGGIQGQDTIGRLFKSIPLSPPPKINLIDAALVAPKDGVPIKPEIAILNTRPTGIAKALSGMQVQKVGRSTGHTNGTVSAVKVMWKRIYYPDLGRHIGFDNLIVSDLHCEKGDSGAILLNDNFEAVGLCTFKIGNKSMSIPMETICKAFQVDICI